MSTETITWHSVAEQLPDDETTVLLSMPLDESTPVWPGYLEAGIWHTADAMPLSDGHVVAWAEMPGGVSAATGEACNSFVMDAEYGDICGRCGESMTAHALAADEEGGNG